MDQNSILPQLLGLSQFSCHATKHQQASKQVSDLKSYNLFGKARKKKKNCRATGYPYFKSHYVRKESCFSLQISLKVSILVHLLCDSVVFFLILSFDVLRGK